MLLELTKMVLASEVEPGWMVRGQGLIPEVLEVDEVSKRLDEVVVYARPVGSTRRRRSLRFTAEAPLAEVLCRDPAIISGALKELHDVLDALDPEHAGAVHAIEAEPGDDGSLVLTFTDLEGWGMRLRP